MDYRTHSSVIVMKHFQCNRLGCKHLHEQAATFTSVKHRPVTCHFLRNSDLTGFADLYIFSFVFFFQSSCCFTIKHIAANRVREDGDDGPSTSTQQPLTISSLPDSDEAWLSETAQVIEVSTVAIYQAICEHKDDKLFCCYNQFSAISGCHMSRGLNRAMSSIIGPFFQAVELRPKRSLKRRSWTI